MEPEDEYENLNHEISNYQFEHFVENMEVTQKKALKNIKKELLTYCGPLVFLFIMYLITQNTYFIYGMPVFSGLCAMKKLLGDFKKNIGLFKDSLSVGEDSIFDDREDSISEQYQRVKSVESYYRANKESTKRPVEAEDQKKYDEALKKQLKTRIDLDIKYDEALKRQMQGPRGDEQRKYQKAVENQLKESSRLERRKYDDALKRQQEERENEKKKTTPICTKRSAITELFREIRLHQRVYILPPIMIGSDEWNAFFDTIYAILKAKDNEQNFYRAIRYVVRRTLVKALVKEQNCIYLQDIIDNLNCLNFMNFTEEELNEMASTIQILTSPGKVIRFKPKKDIS